MSDDPVIFVFFMTYVFLNCLEGDTSSLPDNVVSCRESWKAASIREKVF